MLKKIGPKWDFGKINYKQKVINKNKNKNTNLITEIEMQEIENSFESVLNM